MGVIGGNKVLIVEIKTDKAGTSTIDVISGVKVGDEIVSHEHSDIIGDMASLCEAICTLIHVAEADGVKTSSASLKSCIHHLEQGTFDSSYKKRKLCQDEDETANEHP